MSWLGGEGEANKEPVSVTLPRFSLFSNINIEHGTHSVPGTRLFDSTKITHYILIQERRRAFGIGPFDRTCGSRLVDIVSRPSATPRATSRNSRRFFRARGRVSLFFARAVGDARAPFLARAPFHLSAMVAPLVECPADCGWRWTQTWFGDCACGDRDRLSFALGLASILAWGTAELPQIYANFRNGRSEGISLAFIVTWLTGDAFNLLGCAVSPTLPTQLYTALMYTATTVVLIAQHLHYNSRAEETRRQRRRLKNLLEGHPDDLEALLPAGPGPSWSDEDDRDDDDDDAATTTMTTRRVSFTPSVASVASEAAASVPGGRAIHRHAARGRGRDGDGDGDGASFNGTWTTPSSARTFLAASWQAPAASTRGFSPPARRAARASLGGGGGGSRRASARLSASLAAAGALSLLGILSLAAVDASASASSSSSSWSSSSASSGGRGLLSGGSSEGYRHAPLVPAPSWVGASLGWAMTCIYLSGRVPQILMNHRRGSVEGLSISMFTLAVVGNATYMASILARSTAWSRVKPNLPWLVDAGACLLMDAVILGQHAAYAANDRERAEDWEEDEEEGKEEDGEDGRSAFDEEGSGLDEEENEEKRVDEEERRRRRRRG